MKYQVDGVVHRQSTHTRDYRIAKTWASQIEIARRVPTFEEAVEVLKMFYRKPVDGILEIDAAWPTYLQIAKAVGKDSVTDYTMGRRKLAFDRFVAWLKKERATVKTVEAVTGPIAAGFAAYLASKLKLKSKTRINNIGELSTIWKLLETASDGVRNPWSNLRPHDVDGRVGHAFSHEDERRVLEAAKEVGKDWFEVCTIMRHTGLRYGDVALLSWSSVDGDVLRVKPRKTARHGVEVAIPIIKPIHDILETLPKTGDFLFPVRAEAYGKKKHTANDLAFRDVLVAAGLEDKGYTIHSWRHTAATRLAEHGADKDTRKAILGHTVDATAERYDHDDHIDQKRRALERAAT